VGWLAVSSLALRRRGGDGRRFRGAFSMRLFGFGGSDRLIGRLFGGFIYVFLRWDSAYRIGIAFVIACQISLTPRPSRAENGSGSTPSWRMAFNPCSVSLRFNLSTFVATTRYGLPWCSSQRFRSRSFSIHPRRASSTRQ